MRPPIFAVVLAAACAPDDEGGMPVVAQGRYVTIATDRDEAVCGGTAAYMDRVLEAAFAVMDEPPPEGRFVRFEWLELDEEEPTVGGGIARLRGDAVVIRSDVFLVEEHELVHAAQLAAWPSSNAFLVEGHAVLLDAKRQFLDANPWPASASLDDIIESPGLSFAEYPLAWFLVSQIVLDHGFDGLRDFWHAVPQGSTAAEVREAYESLFGRPIDALVEPYVVEYPDPIGPTEVERRACDFALCPAPVVTPWNGDEWSAVGPIGCEDDPDAIGPDRRLNEWGDVWRDYTMPGEPAFYSAESAGKISVGMGRCGLDCGQVAVGTGNQFQGPGSRDLHYRDWDSPVRVEVRVDSSDLPVDAPSIATIYRSSEPPG